MCTFFLPDSQNISANTYIVDTTLESMRNIRKFFLTELNIASPLSTYSKLNLGSLIYLKILHIH